MTKADEEEKKSFPAWKISLILFILCIIVIALYFVYNNIKTNLADIANMEEGVVQTGDIGSRPYSSI